MRAADRPVWAIFRFSAVPTAISVHTPLLGGRRLTQAVGPLEECHQLFSMFRETCEIMYAYTISTTSLP
jgi:hypothetical protein